MGQAGDGPSRAAGFVFAANRSRDGYEVPLALYEAGLLERCVTDFYAPEGWGRLLPGPLQRRRKAGLPPSATASALDSFAVQSAGELLRLPKRKVFAISDRLLASRAAHIAAQSGSHLYCYSSYLPAERRIAPATRRIVFEYHPLPGLTRKLLQDDAARFPQVRWSLERELGGFADGASPDAWTRADAVVCASAMTSRSLENAGCPPSRITVIPYGVDPGLERMPPVARASDRAEFLFVGQGVQRKGLHHLVEAWQGAGLAHARLTLVCYDIDPGIAAMVRDPTIRLLPRRSRAALDRLYAESDVFVMPSLVEGFGLVYLEALARGCHVLGSANTGLPDLRLSDDAVTLVEAGDVSALAAALGALRDAARRGAFDRHAIAQAVGRWRWRDFRAAIAAHAAAVLAN